MSKKLLRVNDLSYEYGATQILQGVSLELSDRSIALLVGRNGAGKSTLLRCLAGWTWANAGTVEINDVTLRREDRSFRKHVMLVPDTPDFYDELTAWEHLQFAAQLHRVEGWQDRSWELLEKYQLDDYADTFPFTFSRGMRYKLALCIALLTSPALLLLDEPFGPLDASSVAELWEDLRGYRSKGRSVMLSSHALPNGGKADSIFLLRDQMVTTVDPAGVTDLKALLNNDN